MASALQYYVFYKPYKVMTQFSAIEGKKTLADYCDIDQDIYPVGRLDYDSEGLIVLTNDKQLNHQLLHPSQKQEKEYWVQVEGDVTTQAIQHLASGVSISIDGKTHKTLPGICRMLKKEPGVPPRNPPIRHRENIPTTWISLAIKEGKNRQVRKMTAAVGFPTLRLVRWRVGLFTASQMQPGDLTKLSAKEAKHYFG